MSKPHPIARINHSYRLTRSHGAPWLTRQSAGRPLPLRSKGCGRGKSGLGLAELDETESLPHEGSSRGGWTRSQPHRKIFRYRRDRVVPGSASAPDQARITKKTSPEQASLISSNGGATVVSDDFASYRRLKDHNQGYVRNVARIDGPPPHASYGDFVYQRA
jgi:hypothetical protein